MNATLLDQTLALSALASAAALVDATANGRAVDGHALDALLQSVLDTSPESLGAIFPDPGDLGPGIQVVRSMVSRPDSGEVQALRYMLDVIEIEKRLRHDRSMTAALGRALAELGAETMTPDRQTLARELARIYQVTLSRMERRVHVTGKPDLLTEADVAAQIRALLLAGVRAALLWRQLGGRRWHLVLRRSTIRSAAHQLARRIAATE